MPNNQPRTDLPAWQALARHKAGLAGVSVQSLFAQNPKRSDEFSVSHQGIHFDFSRHGVSEETLSLLIKLAQACDLEAEREQLFTGGLVNGTENRAALHTALRGGKDAPFAAEIAETLSRVKDIADEIRADKSIKALVVIGIGGSDCGPHLVCRALKHIGSGPDIRFLSNIDPGHVVETLAGLRPDSTRFILSSKSFSTQETMANAAYAKDWAGGADKFIAVTGNKKAALDFGIAEQYILPVPDWVGGRYSLWSAVGLPIAVTAGFENFRTLLDGAASADVHFRSAPLRANIPALMAMLSVWQRNFEGRPAFAVLPYDQRLSLLPRYVQQLSMESNGKGISRSGTPVNYDTAPIVFGEVGTNGQHAFYQLLHQGRPITPCDIILSAKPAAQIPGHHEKLVANALAQAEALAFGQENTAEPHRNFPGNRPSSVFLLDDVGPFTLGALLAFYEHKTFCEGILWDINSFDQWGVELGKHVSRDILARMEGRSGETLSASSQSLVEKLGKMT